MTKKKPWIKNYLATRNRYVIENNIIKTVDDPSYPEMNLCFGKIFMDIFDRNPNHIFQVDVDKNEKVTFTQMKYATIKLALWLRHQNIGFDDVIGLCANNRTDNYLPLLAALFEGAIFCPWYHEVTLLWARKTLKLVKPKIVFCIEETLEVLMKAVEMENIEIKFVVLGKYLDTESLDDILNSQSEEEVRNYVPKQLRSPNDAAFLAFSSETTGSPKPVLYSYESIFKNFLYSHIIPGKHVKALYYTTTNSIQANALILMGIISEFTRFIHQKFDVEKTLEVIEANKIDFIYLFPSQVIQLVKSGVLNSGRYKLMSLKYILVGASKLDSQIEESLRHIAPHISVLTCYEITETAGVITCQRSDCKTAGSVGFVLPYHEIKVINENGNTLELGEQGEICVRRPLIMLGYYINLPATRKILSEDGWLRTGDKGHIDSNGELFLSDGVREIMIYQGHHVSPSQLESLLLSHKGLLEVCVTSVPHPKNGDRPVAFVIRKPGFQVTEKELIDLSSQLGQYQMLKGVHFLNHLPTNHSGKIDKMKLKEMAKVYFSIRFV